MDVAARILDPCICSLRASERGGRVVWTKEEQVNDTSSRRNGGDGSSSSDIGGEVGYCAPPFGCFMKDYFSSEW